MVMMSEEATAFSSLTSSLYPFYSPIGIYRAKISGALCNVLRSILRSILRRILAATRLLPRTISDLVFLSIFQTPLLMPVLSLTASIVYVAEIRPSNLPSAWTGR